MLAVIEFVKLLTVGAELGKTLAPTDRMKEATQAIQKQRLTANEYDKQLRRLTSILRLHYRQSVDAIVNLNCDPYDADDVEDFRVALYERFPKRKHIKP